MPRTINAATETELNKSQFFYGIFVDLDFPGGNVRVWSGYGDQTLNGDNFLGIGTLGQISGVSESERVSASNVICSLSGVPSDLVSLIFREDYRGRLGKIWRVIFDETGIVGDPLLAFSGRMDVATIDDGKDSGVINISLESEFVDFSRPRLRTYTHEDQKARYPNDTGFLYNVASTQRELPWGRKTDKEAPPRQTGEGTYREGTRRGMY